MEEKKSFVICDKTLLNKIPKSAEKWYMLTISCEAHRGEKFRETSNLVKQTWAGFLDCVLESLSTWVFRLIMVKENYVRIWKSGRCHVDNRPSAKNGDVIQMLQKHGCNVDFGSTLWRFYNQPLIALDTCPLITKRSTTTLDNILMKPVHSLEFMLRTND